MSESRPQNTPASENPKKVVIFTGPTTEEFKKSNFPTQQKKKARTQLSSWMCLISPLTWLMIQKSNWNSKLL
jgi:hypothetical protein